MKEKMKIMFLTNLLPKILFLLLWVLLSMFGMANIARAAPAFQAAGAAVNGTGSVSPVWPTHAVGDVALLFVESAGGGSCDTFNHSRFCSSSKQPSGNRCNHERNTDHCILGAGHDYHHGQPDRRRPG